MRTPPHGAPPARGKGPEVPSPRGGRFRSALSPAAAWLSCPEVPRAEDLVPRLVEGLPDRPDVEGSDPEEDGALPRIGVPGGQDARDVHVEVLHDRDERDQRPRNVGDYDFQSAADLPHPQRLDERLENVRPRDDPGHSAPVVHHGKGVDSEVVQEDDCVLEGVVDHGGDDLAGHDLLHGGVREHLLHLRFGSAGKDSHRQHRLPDVPIRQDADQFVLLAGDRELADVVLAHQAARLLQGGGWSDGCDVPPHSSGDKHAVLLSFPPGQSFWSSRMWISVHRVRDSLSYPPSSREMIFPPQDRFARSTRIPDRLWYPSSVSSMSASGSSRWASNPVERTNTSGRNRSTAGASICSNTSRYSSFPAPGAIGALRVVPSPAPFPVSHRRPVPG